MTGLTTDILEVILKSQLQIENAVMERLKVRQNNYDTDNIRDLISITDVKLIEIRRQITVIEQHK